MCFPLLPLFCMAQKIPGWKINIPTRKSSLSKGNFSPICRNTLGHLLLYTTDDSPVCSTILTDNIYYNSISHMLVPFYWFFCIGKKNAKRGREKGDKNKIIKFKHRGKHDFGCYHKSLLIFTAYQVQGRWAVIITPLWVQPDGRNVREILLKRSCHTHLKHSKTYTFILQKWRILQKNFLFIS